MKYILSGNKKAPIKYIKTGCDLYMEEICCELNGHSNQHDALVAINAELVELMGEMNEGYNRDIRADELIKQAKEVN